MFSFLKISKSRHPMSHHQCLQSVNYLFFFNLRLYSSCVIWIELIWGANHAEEKKTYIVVCQEKKSFTRGLGKKILTQIKSPIPLLKSKMISPLSKMTPFLAEMLLIVYIWDKIIIVCYLSYDLELKTIHQVILYPTILP